MNALLNQYIYRSTSLTLNASFVLKHRQAQLVNKALSFPELISCFTVFKLQRLSNLTLMAIYFKWQRDP